MAAAKKPVLRKPKKKLNPLKTAGVEYIDYKDTALLRKFISDRGKIRARRVTGVDTSYSRSSVRSWSSSGAVPCRTMRTESVKRWPASVSSTVSSSRRRTKCGTR